MASLTSEYRNRRGIAMISPIAEGVLFFVKDNKAQGIVLISSSGRSLDSCGRCKQVGEMILEVLIPNSFPQLYTVIEHRHILPEVDILDLTNKSLKDCQPYVSKGERDQERWLWEFFVSISTGSSSSFQRLVREMLNRKYRTSWIEDLFWMVEHHPDVFNNFYVTLYSTCLINRKYLCCG